MSTTAWIGLGSNLGDREAILKAAVAALADAPGVVVRAVSSYHETRPVGGPPGQGPFLNAAARLETTLGPHQLLAVVREIEDQAGRVRTVRWGERTLDLDILIYDDQSLDTPDLKLPHPRLAFRRFVLAPLAEIAPTIVDVMTGRTIADLLANLDRKPRFLAIDGSDEVRKSSIFRRLLEELPGLGISGANLPSSEVEGDDEWIGRIEGFERKAEAILAGHRAIETLPIPWIVADYVLELDLFQACKRDWNENPPSDRDSREDADREGMLRARLAASVVPPPTLVVILPDDVEERRHHKLPNIPRLRPDSDQPNAIVDEILATCRAIEAV